MRRSVPGRDGPANVVMAVRAGFRLDWMAKVLVYSDRQLHKPVFEDAIRLAFGPAGADVSIHADAHYRLARKLAAAQAIDVIRV